MILSNNSGVKRLAIYIVYDINGRIADYIPYMLEGLKQNVTELCVVCNGRLSPKGRTILNKYADRLYVRENVGFDVWAHKAGLDSYGWDQLETYDEIVLLNDTIMGPIYPFANVFDEMGSRDVDFWGLTKYHKEDRDPFGTNKFGYIPEHIQSSFLVFRKSLVGSDQFQQYWDTIPMIHSYEESIGFHESFFTKHFNDLGFKSSVYCDTSALENITSYPLMICPCEMIRDYRCPIFKKRSFFGEYKFLMYATCGQPTQKLYRFLCDHTDYDTSLIWDAVLPSHNMMDIKRSAQLNYILPSTCRIGKDQPKRSFALVMHLYFMDLLPVSLRYASYVPEYTDVYITTNSEKNKKEIEAFFKDLKCNRLSVIVVENRGRDVSALMVGFKDHVHSYEYVCFVHDKKTAQITPQQIGESFGYKCFENTLGSSEFIENVLQTFAENANLGLLSPPPPNHSNFSSMPGFSWTKNFDGTKKLLRRIGVEVPMDESRGPIAPLGTMFWFRTAALSALFDYDWNYCDFPPEPNQYDGTLLHAIERAYPFVAQHHGYYAGWLMSSEYARIEYTNLKFMLDGFYHALVPKVGMFAPWDTQNILNTQVEMPLRSMIKRYIKNTLPIPIVRMLRRIKHAFAKSA